ncbi:MAG: hypothetical protein HYX50_06025 [Chloroflexi bacterium]|nr:hypothetical protein [Chloroflexota bacterium]
MRRSASIAMAGLVLTVAFALAAVGLIVAGGSTPVPDNWGFRGYWALMALLFAVPGTNLALRRHHHPIGWILLWVGVSSAASGAMQEYVTYGAFLHPGALPFTSAFGWILSWFFLLSIGPIIVILLIFPNGRLISRRWWIAVWSAVAFVVLGGLNFAFKPGPLENAQAVVNPFGVTGQLDDVRQALEPAVQVAFIAVAAMGAWAPITRFRRARGDERQQLKWFAYAATLLVLAVAVLMASAGTAKLGQILVILAMGTIPISVAIAVLRYRLYDIDLIINRTLVYGLLSAILAASYFALVVSLQAVLRPITSGSEIAVAASTLAVVAFIQPLRRRIQNTVDRRFYRARYNAVRTLDALTGRLRDEVDLESVRADIVDVIGDTLAPQHASVWLRGERS